MAYQGFPIRRGGGAKLLFITFFRKLYENERILMQRAPIAPPPFDPTLITSSHNLSGQLKWLKISKNMSLSEQILRGFFIYLSPSSNISSENISHFGKVQYSLKSFPKSNVLDYDASQCRCFSVLTVQLTTQAEKTLNFLRVLLFTDSICWQFVNLGS